MFYFCCLGRGRVSFFAVWAGACLFFCCLGGDGNSLTYRPAWLGFKGPNNKKTKQQKKTRVPVKPAQTLESINLKPLT